MASTRPCHVLAIDHAQEVLDLVREVLAAAGYRVSTRCSPVPDPDEIARLGPDVVVLDPAGAGAGGGWPLLRRLRADPSTAAIPVVVCTGAVREAEALRPRLDALGVRVVLKPFALEALLGAVGAALAPA